MTFDLATIEDLNPDPDNPRGIQDAAAAGLRYSLEEFGDLSGITWNKRTGELVCGHQRVKQLRALGATFDRDPAGQAYLLCDAGYFFVRVVDWPREKQRQANLAANNQAIAGFYTDAVTEQIDALRDSMDPDAFASLRFDDIAPATFDPGDHEDPQDVDEDEAPEPPTDPVTKPGDVWQLGRHRVVCGDATLADTRAVCCPDGAALMVTDPPYGVEYDAEWREGIEGSYGVPQSTGKVTNDDQADWSIAFDRAPIAYVWCASLRLPEAVASVLARGYVQRSLIVWVKPYMQISRGHYHWQYEPCIYAVQDGATAQWVGDRKQSTVWDGILPPGDPYGRSGEDRTEHSTQKPVECMARPLRNHGKAGDVVYDPFLGSGSTLIAAEQLDRVCYGIEIEPRYVDVIIERWQNLTGKKARKV